MPAKLLEPAIPLPSAATQIGARPSAGHERADDPQRPARRRTQRLRMLAMVAASYAVDAILLLGLSWADAIPGEVATLYVLAGGLSCVVFYLILGGHWCERSSDHYLVVPQMLLATAINLFFVAWAPQIGGLLLMVLFIVFAFGALRMSARRTIVGAALVSLLVGTTMLLVGERLAIPMATWQQRAICGVWFALVFGRSMLLGLYGSSLREMLVQRNAQLATTFEKLEHLANRDELTGTLNRRSVMRLLEDERERHFRTGEGFGIALLDLDHFKQVNDGFGHLVGDEVLRRFAIRVAGDMRSTDRLGRYGGEEFLMLLTATSDLATATHAANRVRLGVAQADWAQIAPGLAVTTSIGLTICEAGESIERMIHRADEALYEAKRAGRNRVHAG